jgi:glyoxylase-like metal-dependent hydrolase (beta-lactamase superfamily II)
MSLLVRQPDSVPLLMVGDVTYDIHILNEGRLPGMGNRRQMKKTTDTIQELRKVHPDLVLLPAHDPDAASRLAAANPARI